MPKLPTVTPREVIKALGKAGFYLHHVKGSHHYFRHYVDKSLRPTVAFHGGAVKKGTLNAILKQANLTVDEFINLL